MAQKKKKEKQKKINKYAHLKTSKSSRVESRLKSVAKIKPPNLTAEDIRHADIKIGKFFSRKHKKKRKGKKPA